MTSPRPIIHGGPGKAPPKKGKKAVSRKAQFIWAEGQQESGGNYKAVNANSGALGRWQVMPDNVAPWMRQAGLTPVSDQAFLDSEKDQNAVAWTILGGYFDKYGAAGAAAMWYSGQPNPNENYGNPTVRQYVDDVLALMKAAPYLTTASIGQSEGGYVGVQTISLPSPPQPGKESWAPQIKNVGAEFYRGALAARRQHDAISKLQIRR